LRIEGVTSAFIAQSESCNSHFATPMSRLLRAVVLGSLGAAVSGVVLAAIRPRPAAAPKPLPQAREVEAEALSDAETDALLRELARDLDA
jgi:hypothetical protein